MIQYKTQVLEYVLFFICIFFIILIYVFRQLREYALQPSKKRTRTVVPSPRVTVQSTPIRKPIRHQNSITSVHRTAKPPREYGPFLEFDSRRNIRSGAIVENPSSAHMHHGGGEKECTLSKGRNEKIKLWKLVDRKRKIEEEINNVVTRRRSTLLPTMRGPPSVLKTSWDYLLDEMTWMATDFVQERRWKIHAAQRLALDAVNKKNQEKIAREVEKRSIAKTVASKISTFWRSMERVAARSRLRFAEGEKSKTGKNQLTSRERHTSNESTSILLTVDASSNGELSNPTLQDITARTVQIRNAGLDARKACSDTDRWESELSLLKSTDTFPYLYEYQWNALRWMWTLHESNVNFVSNHQFGLDQVMPICAFLKLQMENSLNEGISLIIAPSHDVHHWIHCIMSYFKPKEIQVFGGNEIKKRRQIRMWEKDEKSKKDIRIVLASHEEFVQHKDAFADFSWRLLIAQSPETTESVFKEVEEEVQTKELEFAQRVWSSMITLNVTGRRVLVTHTTIHSSSSRALWLRFLDIVPSLKAVETLESIACESHTGAEDVLDSISYRQLRNDVEMQLPKVDEQSTVCSLTFGQMCSYRDALLNASLEGGSMAAWFRLLLRLRAICNGVEACGLEKAVHMDSTHLEEQCGKLAVLGSLLLNYKEEGKRVVLYAELGPCLALLEVFINRLGMNTVRICGGRAEQQQGLAHFAYHRHVHVAIVSTRCSRASLRPNNAISTCNHAVNVYGADVVIVFDSDWDPVVDAKLRASWQQIAHGRPLPVYRFHCEDTLENALLRSGSCLSEKLFTETTPRALVRGGASTSGGLSLMISTETIPAERPSWWRQRIGNKDLLRKAAEVSESYHIDTEGLSSALLGGGFQELDDLEHLVLSNTDELLPIEWFAVHVVQSAAQAAMEATALGPELIEDDFSERIGLDTNFLDDSPLECALKKEQSMDDLFYTPSEDAYINVLNEMQLDGFMPEYEIYDPFNFDAPYVNPLVDEPLDFGLVLVYQEKPTPEELKPIEKKINVPKKTINPKRKPGRQAGTKRKIDDMTAEERESSRKRKALTGADAFSNDYAYLYEDYYFSKDEKGIKSILPDSLEQTPKKKLTKAEKERLPSPEMMKEWWTALEDQKLLALRELYGSNWNLICFLLNESCISSINGKKRSSRQCCERVSCITGSGNTVIKHTATMITGAINYVAESRMLQRRDSSSLFLPLTIPAYIRPIPMEVLPSVLARWKDHAVAVPLVSVHDVEYSEMTSSFSGIVNYMRAKGSTLLLNAGEGPSSSPSSRLQSTQELTSHTSHDFLTQHCKIIDPVSVTEISEETYQQCKKILGTEPLKAISFAKQESLSMYGNTLQNISSYMDDVTLPRNRSSSSLLHLLNISSFIRNQVKQCVLRKDLTEGQKVDRMYDFFQGEARRTEEDNSAAATAAASIPSD